MKVRGLLLGHQALLRLCRLNLMGFCGRDYTGRLLGLLNSIALGGIMGSREHLVVKSFNLNEHIFTLKWGGSLARILLLHF